MLNSALTRLATLDDNVSPEWLALGKQHMALQQLLLCNHICDHGDTAAHVSVKPYWQEYPSIDRGAGEE
jgi:hypothetical protein